MLEAKEYAKIFADRIAKGAFLTTCDGQKSDTMTIGWGCVGYMWAIPTVTVMVRQTRLTKENLNQVKSFTISVPVDDSYKDAIALCGTKSGRDLDKFAAAGLKCKASKAGTTPVIDGKGLLQLECTVLYERLMDVDALAPELKDKWYRGDTEHTIYVAKITDAYLD